jgi:hypothetical protein
MSRIRVAGAVFVAFVGLGVAGGAVPAGAAGWQITVSPSTGLADGQSVGVTGTGFTEHPLTQFVVDWAIAECNSTVLNQPLDPVLFTSNCDITTTPFVFVHADAAGNVAGTFPVRSSFTTGNGTAVDCVQTQCALAVAQITDAGFVGAVAPISFGSVTPPTCPKGERPGHGYGDRNHCHRFEGHRDDRHHDHDDDRGHNGHHERD